MSGIMIRNLRIKHSGFIFATQDTNLLKKESSTINKNNTFDSRKTITSTFYYFQNACTLPRPSHGHPRTNLATCPNHNVATQITNKGI